MNNDYYIDFETVLNQKKLSIDEFVFELIEKYGFKNYIKEGAVVSRSGGIVFWSSIKRYVGEINFYTRLMNEEDVKLKDYLIKEKIILVNKL